MRNIFRSFFCLFICLSCQSQYDSFTPGKIWLDDKGVAINAHGGGFLYKDGTYYWYGEHKTEGRLGHKANVGVHVYSSQDLYNWKDEGIALKVVENDSTHDITNGSIIERPKVIFNELTQTYVMWFHLELINQGYKAARTAVARSKSPTGPFEYLKSYRPNAGIWPIGFPDSLKTMAAYDTAAEKSSEKHENEVIKGLYLRRDFEKGQMARDMTLFVDEDGTAYHIHASEENRTLHIAELTSDYINFTGKYARVLADQRNEAPAIIKRKGKYIMITSGLTGWSPNPARLSTADHIFGPWASHGNPCVGDDAEITFESQSTFILPVQGIEDQYIFMADRWRPENAIDAKYVWLPILFENELPVLKWHEKWDLSIFK